VRTTRIDLPVYIGSVPTEHLDSFPEKLKTSLKRIADEGIDMERMKTTINRDERQVCFPDFSIQFVALMSFLAEE
jgi:Zn-dependent M16 (insulinase) family peptidase